MHRFSKINYGWNWSWNLRSLSTVARIRESIKFSVQHWISSKSDGPLELWKICWSTNKCTHMPRSIQKIWIDWKIIRLQGSKAEWGTNISSLEGLLKCISSTGLEASEILQHHFRFCLHRQFRYHHLSVLSEKMKLIKCYLRSTVSQDRFINLVFSQLIVNYLQQCYRRSLNFWTVPYPRSWF